MNAVLRLSAFIAIGLQTADAQLVQLETVSVGNPGNRDNASTGYGGVDYVFRMGKMEVTIGQYAIFLNAVATRDTASHITDLWDSRMQTDANIAGIGRTGTGTAGDPWVYTPLNNSGNSGDRPIAYISWHRAARFANWLHNGATVGSDTETGAYEMLGTTSSAPVKNPDARWWIPSRDEWDKAAYYEPGSNPQNDGYWTYPTRTNMIPTSGEANYRWNSIYTVTGSTAYSSLQNYLVPAGDYSGKSSHYGTLNQGGNLAEWTDTLRPGEAGARFLRGGQWGASNVFLEITNTRSIFPGDKVNSGGFRLAASDTPSPVTVWAQGFGLAGNDALPDADPDGDGQSNSDEYVNDTNPASPASAFRPVPSRNGGGFRLDFPSLSGRTYQLFRLPSLTSGAWTAVGDAVAGDGQPRSVIDADPPAGRSYYRLSITRQ